MPQPTPRDKYFMRLALQVAKGSKCCRAQYGSVLVSKVGTILSTGYNGKPAGAKNDTICYRQGLEPNCRSKPGCCIHSEVNCLLFSNHIDRQGGTLYVTGKPCKDCSLVILNSGVSRLVYWGGNTSHGHQGDSDDTYWESYGVPIERVEMKEEDLL